MMAFTSRISTRLLTLASQQHSKHCWGHFNSTFYGHGHVTREIVTVRHFGTCGHLAKRNQSQSNLGSASARGVRSLHVIGMSSLTNLRPWQKSFCRYSSDAMETNQLQEIRDWIEEQRENIYEIPMNIKDSDVEYMRTLTKNERRKYLRKLYMKEQKQLMGNIKKPKSDARKSKPSDVVSELSSTFILRSRRENVHTFNMWRAAAAMKFSPEIAIDFMHEQSMTKTYTKTLIKQILYANSSNLTAQDPFHLHLVNFEKNGQFIEEMNRMHYSMDTLMVDVTSKGLLELFSRDKILYICPDSNNRITSYDPNTVYVVPALCCAATADRGAILAEAKKLGVAHARPLVYGDFPNVEGLVKTLRSLKISRDSGKAVMPNLHKVERKKDGEKFSFSRAKKQKSGRKKKLM